MHKRRKFNVVIDANWYVSASINKKSRRTLYDNILKNNRLKVYYSKELLQEFEGVIHRKRFAKIINANQIFRFVNWAVLFLNKVEIKSIPKIVRDKKDDYLLGICDSCKADFLVTGDEDLLVLETYQNTTILTMGQFIQLLSLI
jgi:uncharacterized protein